MGLAKSKLLPRCRAILRRLRAAYPDARCALHHDNPLQLLIATILSAQCTDARVNLVTPALFKRYRTAADFAAAPSAELESLVRSTGFFRNKARSIRNCCHGIATKHAGKVPDKLVELIQLDGIGRKTADLIIAQDALAEKLAVLQYRLIAIAKRGPLYQAQVLFAAESFGDLLSRYKYLYLISRQDRQLVADVEALRDSAAQGRNVLLTLQGALSRRRDERAEENQQYRQLEQLSQRSLRQSQQQAERTQQRLAQLAKDEARVNDIIASFERRRLADASRGAAASPARIRTADLGQLDWPVNGDIIYRFGRQQLPNGTTIRRDGIGIAVPRGTPVHAIADGTVRSTRSLGTYGPSVVIEHGGGFYSVYLYLSEITVRDGETVSRGQVVAHSGGENSDEHAHIEFQIRGEEGGERGQVRALDPVTWLRRRR